ncbi:hypothetical protein BCR39DRAFT_522080 [Naematelia encephala]|uniref:Uncharacterized protein n=1 Tax=Naematelia encephala TaxID=71784 RepID=A0A1Y2BDC9_9TREE|nr:hypothetical protein BCR39DRAFT_522080 [Naematelia encephala]
MAPLLRRYFAPRQRSLLSTLFTATFLGAVIVVAFPCPARPSDRSAMRLDGEQMNSRGARQDVVVMMNERGKRRFIEER